MIFAYWKLEFHTIAPNPEEHIFKSQPSGQYGRGPITRKIIRSIIQKYKTKAGIETRITPHTFRHSFLSQITRNRDIQTAKELAGHSSITSTERYLHSSTERKRDAIESLDYEF